MQSKVSPTAVQSKPEPIQNLPPVAPSIKLEELQRSDMMIPERRKSKEKYQLVVKGKSVEMDSGRETTFKQSNAFNMPLETDNNILMTMTNAPLNPVSGNCSLLPDSPFKDKNQHKDETQSGMETPEIALRTPSMSAGDEERMHDPTPYASHRNQHLLQHPHHQRGDSQTTDSPQLDRRPLQQRRTEEIP